MRRVIFAVLCYLTMGGTVAFGALSGGDLGQIVFPGDGETGGAIMPTCCTHNLARVTEGCNSPSSYTCSTSSGTKTVISCESCASGYIRRQRTLTTTCGSATYYECNSGGIIPMPTCLAGQYLSGGNCVNCPGGGTSNGISTLITGCYLPKNKSYSDTSGTYEYTSDCYYSN